MPNNNSIHPEKFSMLNEDQKFVNEILDRAGYEVKWLADKLRMDYELVRYQLRNATNYRQDFHTKVIDVFRKEGLISSNSEACEKLKDELIDFSAILTGSVSIVSKSVKEKISDNNLTEQEKKELKNLIRNQLNRITDQINDLLLTIDMK